MVNLVRILTISILSCFVQQLDAQKLKQNVIDDDTLYYLNVSTKDFQYFEDANQQLDFTEMKGPCYLKKVIALESDNIKINSAQENINYFKNRGLLCISTIQLQDPFGNSGLAEFTWEKGLCNNFEEISLSRTTNHKSRFRAHYPLISDNSEILNYFSSARSAHVEGTSSVRFIPLGKRHIITRAWSGDTQLIRLEEKHEPGRVTLSSNEGFKKELLSSERLTLFRNSKRTKYLFVDESNGQVKLNITIQSNQKTIVDYIHYRFENKPINVKECTAPDELDVYVFPNPSFGEIYLKFNATPVGNYNFVVYNIIGKQIADVAFEIIEEDEQIKLILPELRKGTYLYSVNNKDGERLVTRRLSIVNH